MKIKYILAYMCIALALVGCNKENNEEAEAKTAYEVDIEDKSFVNSIYTVIRDGSDASSKYFTEDFIIAYVDQCKSVEVKEKYKSNNAIYIVVDSNGQNIMFRFQLDTNGLITSYIRYNLEA